MSAIAPIRNVWSKSGLDLTDSAFSRIYQTEVTFSKKDDSGESLKKFELEPTRFEELCTLLIRKQNRMAMKKLLQVKENGVDLDLLDQPQLISKTTMITHRDTIWNSPVDLTNDSQADVNLVYDQQLKCHALGSWILSSFTNRAIQKLECSKSDWSVEKNDEIFLHGPLLFWFFVDAVKPNNDTLVQNTKDKLGNLNVKDFDFSVRDMLVEFDNLCTEITVRLKGQITEDECISSLWRCLETMKDEHFSRIVSDEKRAYRRSPAANRKSNVELIELFKREQTDLEADGKWNCPNKDQQILTLTSILQNVVRQVNNVTTGNFGNPNNLPVKKSGRSSIPEWKYLCEEGQTEIERDGKTYWWCDKHDNPVARENGMWARHKPEEHKDDFRQNRKNRPANAPTVSDNTASSDSSATVQVDQNLFNALRSGADVQSFLNSLEANEMNLNE